MSTAYDFSPHRAQRIWRTLLGSFTIAPDRGPDLLANARQFRRAAETLEGQKNTGENRP